MRSNFPSFISKLLSLNFDQKKKGVTILLPSYLRERVRENKKHIFYKKIPIILIPNLFDRNQVEKKL